MLSQEQNQALTAIGPGTPMGEVFRRYWLPVALTEESPSPTARRFGCACSARISSLFATPTGNVGLVERVLPAPARADVLRPQRRVRVALRLPRLEIRRDGTCVDMPSEPPDSLFKTKVHDRGLSDVGRRRHDLGLHGAAGETPPPSRITNGCARRPRTASCRRRSSVQLAAGARRRPRHRALVVPAQQNIADRSRLLRDRHAPARSRSRRPGTASATPGSVDRAGRATTCASTSSSCRRSRCAATYRGRGTIRATHVPTIGGHIWLPIDDAHTLRLQLHVLARAEIAVHRGFVRRERDPLGSRHRRTTSPDVLAQAESRATTT